MTHRGDYVYFGWNPSIVYERFNVISQCKFGLGFVCFILFPVVIMQIRLPGADSNVRELDCHRLHFASLDGQSLLPNPNLRD